MWKSPRVHRSILPMYRPVTGLWGFPITCPIHSFIKACKFWRKTSQMIIHTLYSKHTCCAICRQGQREEENRQLYQEVILWQCWYKARFDSLKKVKPLSRPPVGETWQSISVFQNFLLLLISFPPTCVNRMKCAGLFKKMISRKLSAAWGDLGKFSEQLWARKRLKCLLEWRGILDPVSSVQCIVFKRCD